MAWREGYAMETKRKENYDDNNSFNAATMVINTEIRKK